MHENELRIDLRKFNDVDEILIGLPIYINKKKEYALKLAFKNLIGYELDEKYFKRLSKLTTNYNIEKESYFLDYGKKSELFLIGFSLITKFNENNEFELVLKITSPYDFKETGGI